MLQFLTQIFFFPSQNLYYQINNYYKYKKHFYTKLNILNIVISKQRKYQKLIYYS